MRLDINLSTRHYINHRLVNSLIYSAIVLLLICLTWNTKDILTDWGELDRLNADIGKFERRLNERPTGASEQEFSRLQTDIRFYNTIIIKKSRDWLGLLDKLESATPEGVFLTTISSDSKTGEIKLEGKARSFATIRNYLERIEESRYFSDVLLASHQNTMINEGGSGFQFNITCKVVTQ